MKSIQKYLSKMAMCLTLVITASMSTLSSAADYDPIIFVHGYSGSTIVNFTSMIQRFKNAGYPSNRLHYYTYNSFKGVKAGAQTLKNKVAQVLASTGKSKVDIIAHSMGGLVSRYYMKKLGGSSKVDQLVNVASPHKGTAWAYVDFFSQAGKDMRPGSSVLNSINGYYPGLNLWSSCDEIIIPNSSARVGNSSYIGCWEHIASTWSWGVFTKARDYVRP